MSRMATILIRSIMPRMATVRTGHVAGVGAIHHLLLRDEFRGAFVFVVLFCSGREETGEHPGMDVASGSLGYGYGGFGGEEEHVWGGWRVVMLDVFECFVSGLV